MLYCRVVKLIDIVSPASVREVQLPHRILLFALLICLSSELDVHAQTFEGDLLLDSQAQIDTFAFTRVAGDLRILGSDVTNVDGLSELVAVDGSLVIMTDSLSEITASRADDRQFCPNHFQSFSVCRLAQHAVGCCECGTRCLFLPDHGRSLVGGENGGVIQVKQSAADAKACLLADGHPDRRKTFVRTPRISTC